MTEACTPEPRDGRTHVVVVNSEKQYSLWPRSRPLPQGWAGAGFVGSESECLDHIADVWLDLRPRSVRERLAAEEPAAVAEAARAPAEAGR
ncbi:MbtH family protein [Motilibacter deserti]|uniref:MbtH family NRPS accessory protein n=1 Tax=Motilibacter deserti TaxID=2714956 RepID=A0ABX0GZM6_9ACTN|nr:MbtH family NRPS accessory protein [Motilibacter deserti]NHC16045.1 MbtH family NRPS accessory protein [Motilibacter deserti]